VVHTANNSAAGMSADRDGLIEQQYASKANLRPIYDKLVPQLAKDEGIMSLNLPKIPRVFIKLRY